MKNYYLAISMRRLSLSHPKLFLGFAYGYGLLIIARVLLSEQRAYVKLLMIACILLLPLQAGIISNMILDWPRRG